MDKCVEESAQADMFVRISGFLAIGTRYHVALYIYIIESYQMQYIFSRTGDLYLKAAYPQSKNDHILKCDKHSLYIYSFFLFVCVFLWCLALLSTI